MATLAEAKHAQLEMRDRLKGRVTLAGIGITEVDGSYAIKINVAGPQGQIPIPNSCNGVPIIVTYLGKVVAR